MILKGSCELEIFTLAIYNKLIFSFPHFSLATEKIASSSAAFLAYAKFWCES